jgi:cell division transport system permease protein
MASEVEKYNKRGLQTGYISVIVGISLVLFMLGLVIGAYFGLDNLQSSSKENVEIDLFFNPSLNEADIKLIEQELKQWDEIKSVWFVSPERALEVFQDSETQLNEIKSIFDGNSPFPPSVTFNPKSEHVSIEGLAAISAKLLAEYPNQIDEVNYDENRVNDVNLGFLRWIYIFIAIGLLLAIIAFAMINNTIRLALYSKRFTIKTMQLVGAKPGFIRKPFLLSAIGQGFLSAIIGMGLLMGVFYGLNKYMEDINVTYDLETFGLLLGSLLGIGIFISLLSTWFALNKYLRKRVDDLY